MARQVEPDWVRKYLEDFSKLNAIDPPVTLNELKAARELMKKYRARPVPDYRPEY